MQHRLWDARDDDAIIYDRERGVFFADRSKVREIDFQGEFFRSRGPPFRRAIAAARPVLWQAGSSEPGREFASKHAESVFGIFRRRRTCAPTPTTSVPALPSTGVTPNL
jgi:alkanesulfonate monooxygenase SsuD/methylene tetrahydromethanopterin reductase-like flavin-dependent oxidoreductase (luciferase family)